MVNYACITLNNHHYFGADVLVHVVWDGDAGETVTDEGYGDIHALEQTNGIDAAEHEATLVEGFGTFGGGTDADCGEGMTYAGEERGFFR